MHLSSLLSVISKGVHTSVHMIFYILIFNKSAKNLFSLCHYGLFCVEFLDKKLTQSIVEYVCNVIHRGEGEEECRVSGLTVL